MLPPIEDLKQLNRMGWCDKFFYVVGAVLFVSVYLFLLLEPPRWVKILIGYTILLGAYTTLIFYAGLIGAVIVFFDVVLVIVIAKTIRNRRGMKNVN